MKKRPVLKPGDICKLSNKRRGRKKQVNRDVTAVVISVLTGDGSDGRSSIKCTVYDASYRARHNRVHRATYKRNELWFTGSNITDQQRSQGKQQFKEVQGVKNNDGRESCYVCGTPTQVVMGFNSAYNCCVNPACKWKGN